MEAEFRRGEDSSPDKENKDKTARNTIYPGNEDIERMPDSDQDYRLPEQLPKVDENEKVQEEEVQGEAGDPLIDERTDLTEEELVMLEDGASDLSSDETLASDLLDDTDEEGDALNEGPDEDNLFDTGEDLDMPPDVNDPDGYTDGQNDR